MCVKKRIVPSAKMITQIKPYWKKLQKIDANFRKKVYDLERQMSIAVGIDDLAFFKSDEGYVGIGIDRWLKNGRRAMSLIHDITLDKKEN